MSSDWVDMELGQFVELKRGYDLPRKKREQGNIPLISSSGHSDYHNVAKVKGPGVVTGRYGTIGEVFYIEEDFWPLNTTLYVKDFKGNNPLFAYFFLQTLAYSDYSDKAAVPGINRNHLHKAVIRVPIEPSHQKKIASYLWNFNQKIQLNHQTNQTLESIAQAIFKSWFVDFDPVKAKITTLEAGGSQAAAEQAAMMAISAKSADELVQMQADDPEAYQQLAETAALFPAKLAESELGLIPEGWEVTRFKKIVSKYIDNRGKTPPIEKIGIPLLEVKHLPADNLLPNTETEKRVSEHTYKTWFRAHLKAKDLIMSTVGTIGRICIVPPDRKIAVAQNILGLRFDEESANPHFMYYQMSSVRFKHDMDARLVITVQASIKRKDLETIDLLKPPIGLQNHFAHCVEPMIKSQQSDENLKLAALRETLLPKLLSGEIDLSQLPTPEEIG